MAPTLRDSSPSPFYVLIAGVATLLLKHFIYSEVNKTDLKPNIDANGLTEDKAGNTLASMAVNHQYTQSPTAFSVWEW
ncbi:uncharacterized protein N7458_007904 [Penicillium daleae]|uniref:Uncharacterized protein n=1 Tax=Penicillium daleae TaxID=63821 RepID=A0AAD6C1H3_9EURO|nr:uncharacterized protein N7458_007904 [Penicillium daleae]KAJ5444032.1 hypothetical protein N7458_007904 [Penicillium daleae]